MLPTTVTLERKSPNLSYCILPTTATRKKAKNSLTVHPLMLLLKRNAQRLPHRTSPDVTLEQRSPKSTSLYIHWCYSREDRLKDCLSVHPLMLLEKKSPRTTSLYIPWCYSWKEILKDCLTVHSLMLVYKGPNTILLYISYRYSGSRRPKDYLLYGAYFCYCWRGRPITCFSIHLLLLLIDRKT